MSWNAFIADQSGAVTVDWVVLSSALMGLGIAVTAVIAPGVQAVSSETSDSLSGVSIVTRFAQATGLDDFENGLGNWIGGLLDYNDTYGNTMRMGGTGGLEGAQATYELDPDADYATMTFDFHAIDSWDGEDFIIFADGEAVATASFVFWDDGAHGSWVSDNPDVSFSMSQTTSRAHVGHDPGYTDQSYQMEVTVANPGPEITFGFGSTLNQEYDDESFAVDNIQVTSGFN
ncbi:MAG: hypothetical protein AAF914_03845 [Pseudomonadota bacterium]